MGNDVLEAVIDLKKEVKTLRNVLNMLIYFIEAGSEDNTEYLSDLGMPCDDCDPNGFYGQDT